MPEGFTAPPNPPHNPSAADNLQILREALLSGQRRALAKAITLIESQRPADEQRAQQLLAGLPASASSVRIGLTGVPGVGKSTFIEAFGLYLVGRGHRVAVLAVDPSSVRTGGSIMGDKTRMPGLAVHPAAFIRPSPSGGNLGGVARRTRETILLCEAAGYDVLLVETVGVGQSETQVAALTDLFVLLTLPNAGDELQGIKRGIMELADICVVNKADLNPAAATRAQTELRVALTLLGTPQARWQPQVMQASALQQTGMAELWQLVQDFLAVTDIPGKRQAQTVGWFNDLLREAVWKAFLDGQHRQADIFRLQEQVQAGQLTPVQAVGLLLPAANN